MEKKHELIIRVTKTMLIQDEWKDFHSGHIVSKDFTDFKEAEKFYEKCMSEDYYDSRTSIAIVHQLID